VRGDANIAAAISGRGSTGMLRGGHREEPAQRPQRFATNNIFGLTVV
jgi:hypothetical protein